MEEIDKMVLDDLITSYASKDSYEANKETQTDSDLKKEVAMINSLQMKMIVNLLRAEKEEYEEIINLFFDTKKDLRDTHEERLALILNAKDLENTLEELN